MSLRAVDLFAGGGGLSLGFQKGGFDVVAAIESWQPAIDVYKANFPKHPVLQIDLANVAAATKAIKLHTPDLIIGGPPCQDFSSAGKRDEKQGRAELTVRYAQIIAKVKPQYFLMENVARAQKSEAFEQALTIFKKSGYGISIRVLNAAYCGAPQLRKRVIVVGSLQDGDGFLDDALDGNLSKTPMTLRQYFGATLDLEHYYRHPRSYARRGIFSIDEPSPTIRGVNRPMPGGYPGHEGDSTKKTSSVRCLTTQERALIQTFPKKFKLIGNKTDIEQVIGNAVPVKLAEYIAKCLFTHIENKAVESKRKTKPVSRRATQSNSLQAQG